jgi:hypothetical protein
VVADSLGSIPALALRACSAVFLVLWVAEMLTLPRWFLRFILNDHSRNSSTFESWLIAATLLFFLFATGLQSPRTAAKLALFTIKLGVAVLIAASIRVHGGWYAVPGGFPEVWGRSLLSPLWTGSSRLVFAVGPLAFLAASLCSRARRRRDVALTALTGLALPLFGTVLVVSLICIATARSEFYRPSLNPNIAMAMWGNAAARALSWRMMVAVITIFGAIRFGVIALAESLMLAVLARRWRLIVSGLVICTIAWISVHLNAGEHSTILELAVEGLVVTAAVITADFVAGRWRMPHSRWIDWIGVAALLAGLATPLCLPHRMQGFGTDGWWHPWILPSYGVAFAVCLSGRALRRLKVTNRPSAL